MKQIKKYFINRFQIIFTVGIIMLISMILLMLRLRYTDSFLYFFLVWNVFLAGIPCAISFFLKFKKEMKNGIHFLWFIIWLLFLPNAPYIVTDYLHLRFSSDDIIVFDSILIGAFALNGLLLYFISLRDMESLLLSKFSKSKTLSIIWVISFLVGFGIYLGRILRWNSWNILQQPENLFTDIWNILYSPMEHLTAWLFTISFGISLGVTYFLFKRIRFLQN